MTGKQKLTAAGYALASPPTTTFRVGNRLAVGTNNPSAALQVQHAWGGQAGPDQGLAALVNQTNTSDAHASLLLGVAGSGAGDPFVSFDSSGEAGWSLGMDNSDNNNFKLASSWNSVSTGTVLTVSPGGDMALGAGRAMVTDNVVGTGAAPSRAIRLWDNVRVERQLTAPNTQASAQCDCEDSAEVNGNAIPFNFLWSNGYGGWQVCRGGRFLTGTFYSDGGNDFYRVEMYRCCRPCNLVGN